MPIIGSLASTSSKGFVGILSSGSAAIGNFVSLQTATVTSPQFGISFSNISQSYKHLQLRFRITTNAEYTGYLYFNDDETHANYNYSWLQGNGVNVNVFNNDTSFGYFVYDNTPSGYFSVGIIDIYDYTNTNKRKTSSSTHGWSTNAPQATQNILTSMWKNTSSINKITLKPDSAQNFQVGSTVALYGIKTA